MLVQQEDQELLSLYLDKQMAQAPTTRMALTGVGAGIPAWDPLTLSQTQAWFRSDVTTYLFQDQSGTVPVVNPGDGVMCWGDHKSNGVLRATVANASFRGVYQSDGIQAFSASSFLTVNTPIKKTPTDKFTVYVVLQRVTLADPCVPWADTTGTNSWCHWANDSTFSWVDESGVSGVSLVIVAGRSVMVRLRFNNNLNGSASMIAASGYAQITGTLMNGGNVEIGQFFRNTILGTGSGGTCRFRHILVLDENTIPLSPTDMTNVENWFIANEGVNAIP